MSEVERETMGESMQYDEETNRWIPAEPLKCPYTLIERIGLILRRLICRK